MRNKSALTLGALVTALTVSVTGSASADLAPTADDVIGIGSDTVQNIGDFLADGNPFGDGGYNSVKPKNRMISFDATPDANDRAGYLQGSTFAAPKPLTPTVVLRQGKKPIRRPNGSGDGYKALMVDGTHIIDFVRGSRLPNSSELGTAKTTTGVGDLHTIKISTDKLQLAVGTNSLATGATLTAANIVDIYKCTPGARDWSAFGGSAGAIVPEIPQAGSGTGDTFRADLAILNNNSAVTLGGCVVDVEENDPSTLSGAANTGAIAPFSEGRKNLYDGGTYNDPTTPGNTLTYGPYFNDPTVKFGTTPVPITSGIKFIATNVYSDNRGLYITFRNSDVTATKKFQPGGALNAVQDLFYNPNNVGGVTPFVQGDAGKIAITSAGATWTFVDCGTGTAMLAAGAPCV